MSNIGGLKTAIFWSSLHFVSTALIWQQARRKMWCAKLESAENWQLIAFVDRCVRPMDLCTCFSNLLNVFPSIPCLLLCFSNVSQLSRPSILFTVKTFLHRLLTILEFQSWLFFTCSQPRWPFYYRERLQYRECSVSSLSMC